MPQSMVSRSEAKRLGLTRYRTGKPCKHGHVDERHTSDGQCLECGRIKSARQRAENPEKRKILFKDWYDKNREHNKRRWRAYYDENRERLISRNLECKKKDPERFALYQKVRAYRERGAAGYVDYKELREKLASGGSCAYCGSEEKLTIDHVLPISRGGSNETSNLQVLCSSCNGSKQDKTHDEYMQYLETVNGTRRAN